MAVHIQLKLATADKLGHNLFFHALLTTQRPGGAVIHTLTAKITTTMGEVQYWTTGQYFRGFIRLAQHPHRALVNTLVTLATQRQKQFTGQRPGWARVNTLRDDLLRVRGKAAKKSAPLR